MSPGIPVIPWVAENLTSNQGSCPQKSFFNLRGNPVEVLNLNNRQNKGVRANQMIALTPFFDLSYKFAVTRAAP